MRREMLPIQEDNSHCIAYVESAHASSPVFSIVSKSHHLRSRCYNWQYQWCHSSTLNFCCFLMRASRCCSKVPLLRRNCARNSFAATTVELLRAPGFTARLRGVIAGAGLSQRSYCRRRCIVSALCLGYLARSTWQTFMAESLKINSYQIL